MAKLTVLLLVGVTGCGVVAQSDLGLSILQLPLFTKQVADIQARPNEGATVYLKGTVGDRIPLINQQVYQLQDDTGTIWVLTNQTTLPPGTQVFIRGKVRYEQVSIAGQELGEAYIEEQERLTEE